MKNYINIRKFSKNAMYHMTDLNCTFENKYYEAMGSNVNSSYNENYTFTFYCAFRKQMD